MEIKADKEGMEAVTKLCDVALKTGGLGNMNAVSQILAGLESIPEVEPLPEKIKEE